MKERKRNRLAGFDYTTNAKYFLTICTQNRVCYFGNVINRQMTLNEYGQIANNQMQWMTEQYPYFFVHNFVIMPNHVHILCEINAVGTGRDLSLRRIKSISGLMGAYKTTTSKKIHLSGNIHFQWQRSFHDHIIRNAESYHRIDNYITQNPQKWNEDTFWSDEQ